ncbi:MAG TPA: MerC domain-containing protein [Parasegetibacter sp.]
MRINLDAIGIATSVACAIHCALLPLFLTSLPLFGIEIIHNHEFEAFMIGLAFVIGAVSLFHGYRKHHHSWVPMIVFTAGFCFLVLKQLAHFDQIIHELELPFLIIAVVGIVTAHYLNYRLCRKAGHCHKDDCNH